MMSDEAKMKLMECFERMVDVLAAGEEFEFELEECGEDEGEEPVDKDKVN